MMQTIVILIVLIGAATGKPTEGLRLKRQLTNLFCSNGGRVVSSCINNACGQGYSCDTTRNYCCQAPISTMPTCADGSQASAGCRNGACGPGYNCQTTGLTTALAGGICCRSTTNFVCPNNAPTGGACTTAQTCSSPTNSYTCVNNVCCYNTCPGGTTDTGVSCAGNTAACGTTATCVATRCCRTLTCPDGSLPVGSCFQGQCNTQFQCINGQICCATSNLIFSIQLR